MFSPIRQLVPPYRVNIALWPAPASSFLEFHATRPFRAFRPQITESRETLGCYRRELRKDVYLHCATLASQLHTPNQPGEPAMSKQGKKQEKVRNSYVES
jgi:hypothetical protein